MGKANRERRRMKERVRKQTHATGRSAGQPSAEPWERPDLGHQSPSTLQEKAADLIEETVRALGFRDGVTVARALRELTRETDAAWQHAVETRLDESLQGVIHELWAHGWQPADVVRVISRHLGQPHDRLLRAEIAAELAGYAAVTIDPGWDAQLAEYDVTRWWSSDLTAIQACGRSHQQGWADFVARALELLYRLACLPPLEVLGPVPGTATAQSAVRASAVDERILARVRALLAKAESTSFPAEAETFTAGAQALMARHSIDYALLAASGRSPADQPTGRRVRVDNPYEAPKVNLLNAIASANNCRVVWSKNFGYCTVVGFPTDLDAVEMLLSSLLVQATTSMTREGSRTDRSGRSRTRSFRQSFLLSYADRIRERLTETIRQQAESAAAEPGGGNLLPVLASRADAVHDAVSTMFPRVTATSAGSAWDSEGWASGRTAADFASLSPGAEIPR